MAGVDFPASLVFETDVCEDSGNLAQALFAAERRQLSLERAEWFGRAAMGAVVYGGSLALLSVMEKVSDNTLDRVGEVASTVVRGVQLGLSTLKGKGE